MRYKIATVKLCEACIIAAARRFHERFQGVSMAATRIAIAGLGAIGKTVARKLTDGIPGLSLACIASGNVEKARGWLKDQKIDCPVVELDEFPTHADLAIECAPAALIEKI